MFSWISSDNFLLLCHHHLKWIIEYYHHPREFFPDPLQLIIHPKSRGNQFLVLITIVTYLFIYCSPASYKRNQQCAFFYTEIILFNTIFLRFAYVSMSIIHYFFFAEYTLYWASLWLSGKESASPRGDTGSIPGLGRFPEEGNGNPLQYSCLGNSIDRGA